MSTWMTTTGRTITAATRADAERIARDYGLGEVAAQAPRPTTQTRPTTWIAWDDLCQCVRARGTAADIAPALDAESGIVPMVLGRRGMRTPTRAEWSAIAEVLS